MNILVTGANGQLGNEMRLLAGNSSDKYVFTDISSPEGVNTLILDITDAAAVLDLVRSENIDVIVNCAAYTNVEMAEDNYDLAYSINCTAVANLAAAAVEAGAAVIHVSTDYVFHGDSSVPYTETLPTNPLGVYGVTKLAGENALSSSGCRYLIFRTAWLYSPFGKNFVKTMMKLTSEKPTVSVICDQIGTPTSAADLAALIQKVLETKAFDKQGIYHFTDEGVCSWYDFAKAVRDLCGNCGEVKPCLTSEYPTKAERPHYSVLDKSLVKKTFGIQIPHWYDSLKICMERIQNTAI